MNNYTITSEMEQRLLRMYKKMHDRHVSNGSRSSKPKEGKVIGRKALRKQLIDQCGKCYYTGLEFDPTVSFTHPLYPSVERLDSALGYVEGNVVFVCLFVNYAKNGWDLEEIKPYWKSLASVEKGLPAATIDTNHPDA